MEHCDYVCIRELNGKNDWKYYKIPKEEFILYSRHMKFEGYELQIFVPILLIYKYQIFTNNQTN
jgi:hypothetical protein